MPHRFIDIDLAMVTLNATSIGTLLLAWFSDNLNSLGGFVVMLSVAYLNYAKARNFMKKKNNARDEE